MSPNIWAIIPAHNEEKIIADTINDLIKQTVPIKVLVVLDNCSDDTEKIVMEMIPSYRNLFIYTTINNNKKKAGAINQALQILPKINIDAVLLMDADTRIHCKAVETSYAMLEKDHSLAAVCSKAGVLPYDGKNLFQRFLHQVQKLEYSTFDSQRIETLGQIKVVHGMAGLHRWSSLQEVGGFDDDNLVEDYDLTIRYKMAGYRTSVQLQMKAWTEVPVSLNEWWKQRLRWNRGGLETLRKHGWNKITRKYILQHVLFIFLILFQWFFLTMLILMILQGRLIMHGVVVLITLLGMTTSIYRLKFLEERSVTDYLVRISLIPEFLYEQIVNINQLHAYFLFLFNRPQSW